MDKRLRTLNVAVWQRALLLAIALILSCGQTMADDPINEYELKAAYIFNFIKFIEWPFEQEFPTRDISICAYSADPLLPVLKQLENKPVRGHNILIKVYDSAADIEGCQVVYVAAISKEKRLDILQATHRHPIVTIGNENAYGDNNEMIDFFNQDDKLRFDINFRQVRESGVQMSSRLLKLARVSER